MLKIEKLRNQLLGFLFLLFICFPTVPQLKLVKVILLLIIAAIAYVKKVKIIKDIVILLFLFVGYGFFNIAFGLINGNPGALRVTTVLLIWPMLFTLCIGLLQKQDILKMDKIFILSFKIILAICLIQIIEGITGFSNIIGTLFKGSSSSYIDIENGYVLITNPAVNSLIFILPYFISQAFLQKSSKYYFLSSIGIIVPLITGRRAMILILLSAIFIFLLIIVFLVKRIKLKLYKRIFRKFRKILLLFTFVFIFIFVRYSTQFLNIFFKNKVTSNDERTRQLYSLLEGFSDSPIFGKGAGAVASIIRSYEMPWSYELFYISILFHQGIVGFLLYLIAFIWIMFSLIKIFRNNNNEYGCHVLSILVALICFLIASATNPYIAKLDYIWVLFYPIALINTFGRCKNKEIC